MKTKELTPGTIAGSSHWVNRESERRSYDHKKASRLEYYEVSPMGILWPCGRVSHRVDIVVG